MSKRVEIEELKTVPGKKVVSKIISNSVAKDFDEARTEWDLLGKSEEGSTEFIEKCELCGHRMYKENWLIINVKTMAQLTIGSDCIKRFIRFVGTASQSESNLYFEQKASELRIINELNTDFKDVILDPVPLARQVKSFRSKLIRIIEPKGYKIPLECEALSEEFKKIIGEIFPRVGMQDKMFHKLRSIINDPGSIVTQKENKAFKNFKLKEGQTWTKKNKVTHTTLVGSSAFRPDFKYSETKLERTSSDAELRTRRKQ